MDTPFKLMTAVELEQELGEKYFYRQRTYRYQKSGKLKSFSLRGQQCFLPRKVIEVYINELKAKILTVTPEFKNANVFFDDEDKRMVVDGIFGRYVSVNTAVENEEDLMKKLLGIKEWVLSEPDDVVDELDEPVSVPGAVEKAVTTSVDTGLPAGVFPSEITFIRLDTNSVEGVDVKSYFLFTLPSIARFIGTRTDHLADWVQRSQTLSNYVVSVHRSKIGAPDMSGALKKGFEKGHIPMLPLELIPELLVAFRQSGRFVGFPARAEQLYTLAKSTLEAVGLAISGNQETAAAELAKVSEGLGISASDQVIEIFKRYESKPFQVRENKRFRGKVGSLGKDWKMVTGEITVGVTGRSPTAWKALGTARGLKSKDRQTGREVMRHIEPAASVGITFSESHYLKDHTNMEEVIKTGEQGKEFYQRLKDVGLLDDK